MSAPRFDRGSPHGIITPAYDGAGLQQGEHFFAPNGVYLFSERDGKRYGLGASEAGAQAPVSEPENKNTGDGDLAAWVRGEAKIPFFKLKKDAEAAVPGIDTKNSETIKAGLLAAGIGA